MMMIMHPTYSFNVEIQDRPRPVQAIDGLVDMGRLSDRKYYYPEEGKIGVDEVLALVNKALGDAGLSAHVRFTGFDHKA